MLDELLQSIPAFVDVDVARVVESEEHADDRIDQPKEF